MQKTSFNPLNKENCAFFLNLMNEYLAAVDERTPSDRQKAIDYIEGAINEGQCLIEQCESIIEDWGNFKTKTKFKAADENSEQVFISTCDNAISSFANMKAILETKESQLREQLQNF